MLFIRDAIFSKRGVFSRFASQLVFRHSSRAYPHPSKRSRGGGGGEDAHFCSSNYLGVADGVGGWTQAGVDSGLFSRELMVRVLQVLGKPYRSTDFGHAYQSFIEELHSPSQEKSCPHHHHHPIGILENAYRLVLSKGSSTCCLAFLESSLSQVTFANLGDSGFFSYRPGDINSFRRSVPQLHDFNFPFQLGPESPDLPENATETKLNVKKGDWVVLATDGVWDNLYDKQLIEILDNSQTTEEAADTIATKSFELSLDDYWESPFCLEERRHLYKMALGFDSANDALTHSELMARALQTGHPQLVRAINRIVGGKPDDITVVVSKVEEE